MELHLRIVRQKVHIPCLQPSRHNSCLCGRKRDKCHAAWGRRQKACFLPTASVIPFLLDMTFGQLTSASLSTEGWTSQQAGCPLSCSSFVLIKEHRHRLESVFANCPAGTIWAPPPLHSLHPSTTPGPVKHAELWLRAAKWPWLRATNASS